MLLMHQAIYACSDLPVAKPPPASLAVERDFLLRRELPAEKGGLLKATASAKSSRSDQILSRSAANVRDRGDDADLLQVLCGANLCHSAESFELIVHIACLASRRCIWQQAFLFRYRDIPGVRDHKRAS